MRHTLSPIKKLIATSALTASLLLPTYVASKDMEKNGFSAEFSAGYSTKLVDKVANIPLEIRTVPKSQDDYSWYSPDTLIIKKDSIDLCNRISLGGKFGGKLAFNNTFGLVLGIGADLSFNDKIENIVKYDSSDVSDTKQTQPAASCEVEYKPIERYFSVRPAYLTERNNSLRLSIYSELEIKLAQGFLIGLGYEIAPEKIVAENGWTGTDGLKKRERYTLANLLTEKIYASLKSSAKNQNETVFYALDFGILRILKKDLTKIGKETRMTFNDREWFVGFRVGTRL